MAELEGLLVKILLLRAPPRRIAVKNKIVFFVEKNKINPRADRLRIPGIDRFCVEIPRRVKSFLALDTALEDIVLQKPGFRVISFRIGYFDISEPAEFPLVALPEAVRIGILCPVRMAEAVGNRHGFDHLKRKRQIGILITAG